MTNRRATPAEREGFEPSVRVNAHTISSRARSTTPAPLRVEAASLGVLPTDSLNDPEGRGGCLALGGLRAARALVDTRRVVRIGEGEGEPAQWRGRGPSYARYARA